MDPMSALAIVAIVVQFVDIGGRLIAKGREKQKQVRERNALLAEQSEKLSSLNGTLHQAAKDLESTTDSVSRHRLHEICDECDHLAAELQLISDQPGSSKQKSRPWKHEGEHPDDLMKRLNAFKVSVMEVALLSIWEDTRTTKKHVMQFTDWMADASRVLEGIEERMRIGGSVSGLLGSAQAKVSRQNLAHLPRYEEWAISRGAPSRLPGSPLQADQNQGWSGDAVTRRTAIEMRNLIWSGPSEVMKDLRSQIIDTMSREDVELELLNGDDRLPVPQKPSGGVVRSVAQRITRPFKFVDFTAREAAVGQSILETYSWIFDRGQGSAANGTPWSNFPHWLERPEDPIYWITGKPGAGKSTIMKYVLGTPMLRTHLVKWAGEVPLLVARFYAWHAGTTPQKSILGLKQSLLYQVLEQYPDLIPVLVPRRWAYFWLFNPDDPKQQTVTESEVDESFARLMAISGRTISLAIFIDGLDEFDVPPKEVVALVESIASSSRNGIKICVASRPWVEFEDAYSESPKLQMDLYTGNDMEIFVAARFRKCRAFSELSAAHPIESMNLQQDLTRKANGVFIWLSLVVDALEVAATEGSGVLELREITESLPTDMCALYDVIWDRIPKRNRQRGAILIQTVEVADFTLHWSFVWLLDEYAQRRHDLSPTHLHSVEGSQPDGGQQLFSHIRASLKRRLASRTRGIIVESFSNVDFTHRTARDWAIQPKVRDNLRQECGPLFDPNLLILEIFTIGLTSKLLFKFDTHSKLWNAVIYNALECASRVSDSARENVDSLVQALDTFNERVPAAFDRINCNGRSCCPLDTPSGHWSSYFTPSPPLKRMTFLHLAAQFAVLPYVKAKVKTQRHIIFQPPTKDSMGILEAAVFGYRFPGEMDKRIFPTKQHTDEKVCTVRRLETVQFLLDMGIDQVKMLALERSRSLPYYEWQLRSFRDYLRFLCHDPRRSLEARQYYSEVMRMLGNNNVKAGARVAVMWVKSRSLRGKER
ncbi:hypothetical protein B0T16DRAFT_361439 [Cercophora newfieldiana]|uniref:Nephrocystin 3-like N-terminal domain-containing protein n=1 Tax=Cercophora newfieldiana TaxID=92897 RepID=A0AA40CJV4_9PEZI|nr:hypothetical protein B0T16DRAFT_361439 [Cercophora newfieldiana]